MSTAFMIVAMLILIAHSILIALIWGAIVAQRRTVRGCEQGIQVTRLFCASSAKNIREACEEIKQYIDENARRRTNNGEVIQ